MSTCKRPPMLYTLARYDTASSEQNHPKHLQNYANQVPLINDHRFPRRHDVIIPTVSSSLPVHWSCS